MKETFTAKTEGKGHMDEALKNDLRRNHFIYGTKQNEWKTTTGEGFGGQNGSKPAALDPALAKDLRTHHFALGNQKD
jgi:hypothetical protein